MDRISADIQAPWPVNAETAAILARRTQSECGSELLATSLRYKEWLGLFYANRNAYVFSDRVPQGKFWYILYCAVAVTPTGFTSPAAVHVVPASFVPTVPAGNVDNPFFLTALNQPPTQGSIRIVPVKTFQDTTSQADTQYSISQPVARLFLPSGFALLVWEEQIVAGSAISHAVRVRAVFFELSIGQPIPQV